MQNSPLSFTVVTGLIPVNLETTTLPGDLKTALSQVQICLLPSRQICLFAGSQQHMSLLLWPSWSFYQYWSVRRVGLPLFWQVRGLQSVPGIQTAFCWMISITVPLE